MLLGTMTGLYDWCKENAFYFLGPNPFNRLFGVLLATLVGTGASMPFDAIRIRLYNMRPLPDGRLPYKHGLDAFIKMIIYECSDKHAAAFSTFYAGFFTAYLRWVAIFAVSMYALDFYQLGHFNPEMWNS
jgi:hypothetical protein